MGTGEGAKSTDTELFSTIRTKADCEDLRNTKYLDNKPADIHSFFTEKCRDAHQEKQSHAYGPISSELAVASWKKDACLDLLVL